MAEALLVAVAVVFASKSGSPGQDASPPLRVTPVLLGPGACETSPVIKTIPSEKGKPEPFALKYPIPFTFPKSVPVRCPTLVTSAHGESIRIS